MQLEELDSTSTSRLTTLRLVGADEPLTRLGADEEDLRWYFQRRPRPSCLVSSYPAMVTRMQRCGATGTRRLPSTFDPCTLDDLRRAQRIERILAATDRGSVWALLACLTGSAARHVPTFGHVAPLALETKVARWAHREAGSRRPPSEWLADLILARNWNANAREILVAILAEAEARYRRALLDYREAKRKTGCTGRAAPALAASRSGSHD